MDISGQKYNKLLALEFVKSDAYGNSIWKCRCDCGETSYVRAGALRAGQIKQCKKCADSLKIKTPIENPRIKSIYKDMLRRCYKPYRKNYERYGGRGISVCSEWLENPISFEKWALNNGYSDKLSIDRIDNDGNYEPSNCRWTDFTTQANNRSNNIVLEYEGTSLTIAQWAEKLGVDRKTIYNRIENGESPEVIFSPIDVRQQKSKSGIKGISWSSRTEKWQVRVRVNKKRVAVGTYKHLENAKHALEIFKETGVKITEEEVKRQIENKNN